MKEIIYLENNRQLGYREYGDKNGFAVLALHGTPGSRIWFDSNDAISEKVCIRLITIDRPGYGLSTAKPNRTLNDFNDDLNCLLAKLEIERFSLFGVSGGGAYALAFAASQHPGLHKIGLVASIYEFEGNKVPKEMCLPNRIAFFLARRIPWLLRYSYKQQKRLLEHKPEIYINSIQQNITHLCIADQDVIMDDEIAHTMTLHLREAFRTSASEAVEELRLFIRPWGVDLGRITSKVEIWHGVDDTLSPIKGLKTYISKIPNQKSHFLEGKGHFLDEDPEIWRRILESLKK